ncbi:MAG TPA: iron-sulfur cluster assembly scaffold protein [Candidatus Nanoarchaeia archaeon]|nr:iron-sulfur cluster assembly scaffold protein [Candidatus Nanoarchaeia archaeon]
MKTSYTGKLKEAYEVCEDEIEISLEIDNDKIAKLDFKSTSCSKVKQAAELLAKLIKGKTVKEVVKITSNEVASQLKFDKKDKHAAVFAVSALHLALDDYKNKVHGDPFDEILNVLDKYDKGYPKRDLTDYEVCECGKQHSDKPEIIKL